MSSLWGTCPQTILPTWLSSQIWFLAGLYWKIHREISLSKTGERDVDLGADGRWHPGKEVIQRRKTFQLHGPEPLLSSWELQGNLNLADYLQTSWSRAWLNGVSTDDINSYIYINYWRVFYSILRVFYSIYCRVFYGDTHVSRTLRNTFTLLFFQKVARYLKYLRPLHCQSQKTRLRIAILTEWQLRCHRDCLAAFKCCQFWKSLDTAATDNNPLH